MSPSIHILDQQVANQIAAGEVVERPASVVKELVENALDAGATFIQIEADDGGRSLRIVDNGSGIPAEDLSLAFQRFATSKLKAYQDIWELNTMGFRGEALPSIASISHLEILSRTADVEVGKRLMMQGGTIIAESAGGGPVGTSIQIQELFYNTPARLKFLSREATELGHIQALIQAFALDFPLIAFKWVKKGKTVLQTTGKNDLMGVVRQLFGKEMASSLFTINHHYRGASVTGALSYPDFVRKDRNYQYFFVNQRWVKVPALTRLLDDIYTDLIPRRNHPVAILQLTLPPEMVDVNVHPSKREVKFKNFSLVYQLLREAVNEALKQYDLHRSPPESLSKPQPQPEVPLHNPDAPSDQPEELPPFMIQDSGLQESPFDSGGREQEPITGTPKTEMQFRESTSLYQWSPTQADKEPEVLSLPGFAESAALSREARQKELLETIVPVGQICENTYIVGRFGRDMVLIDQHVAEERYLYERMLQEQEILKQTLLVSVILELSAEERDLLDDHSEVFDQSGFDFEPYGPDTIAIRALPYCLKLGEAEDTFRKLLDDLKVTGSAEHLTGPFKLMCKTVACHAAIRAGDSLSLEQMQEIVKNWSGTSNPYTCPHGRPILLKMSKDEINRRFLRTWS